ncbi:AAA family ATPase [Paraburkholderia fungorum]|uniref:AAA family ATPase n=1 Tax=Paraburkholderia fungorum TaxID=134537 RepID=UPI0038BD8286
MTQNTAIAKDISTAFNAPAADDITILQCRKGTRVTKMLLANGTADGSARATYFTHESRRVAGIRELSALLTELEDQPRKLVLRDRYVGTAETLAAEDRAEKLSYDRALQKHLEKNPGDAFRAFSARREVETYRRGDFFEDRPLHMFLVDSDKFTPDADPLADPIAAIQQFIRERMPPCFHGASFHSQPSSTAGLAKNKGKLKVHLWFWLKTPYYSQQLLAWAKEWAGAMPDSLDPALYRPIQIHYTASPVLAAGATNAVQAKGGFYQGEHDEVDFIFDAPEYEPPVIATERPAYTGDVCLTEQLIRDKLYASERVSSEDAKKINYKCFFVGEHTDGEQGDKTSTSYMLPTAKHPEGRFVCQHTSCKDSRVHSDHLRALFGDKISAEFHDVVAAVGFDTVDSDDAADDPEPASRKFKFYSGDDLVANYAVAPEIVEDVLPERGVAMVYGPSGKGKTFWMLNLAFHVHNGIKWRDKDVKQGDVMYIAAEAGSSITRRMKAVKQVHPDWRAPFAATMAPNLSSRESLRAVRDAAQAAGKPAMVIIDTMSASFEGDDNSQQEVAKMMHNLMALADDLECLVVFVHHTNKNGDSFRGSGVLYNDADAVLELKTEEKDGVHKQWVTQHKLRDGEAGKSYPFSFRVSEPLGYKPNGKPITSLTVVEEDQDEQPAATRVTDSKTVDEAGRRALDRENIARRVRDSARMDPPRYYTATKFRERFAGRAGGMDISDPRMRVLLAELEEDGWVVTGKRPDGMRTPGDRGVLLIGPKAPALPDEWATSDELEVVEGEEALA